MAKLISTPPLLVILFFSPILSLSASDNNIMSYWPESKQLDRFPTFVATAPSYNIKRYGAKPDGRTDSTRALLSAWSLACQTDGPVTVYVPPGRYLVKKVVFQGPCKSNSIFFRIDGSLVAPTDFRVTGYGGDWIVFWRVSGVTISGGTLDGNGATLWHCKSSGYNCPYGAVSLRISNSNRIAINGLISLNSQMFHMIIYGSQDVNVRGVTIYAPAESPNTDGINVQMSNRVSISDSKIATGDDCISIGPGTSNLWVSNIKCGPGHGISIGSLAKGFNEPGVQNIVIRYIYFTGTQNGLRIKTWGRPSNGFVRNVLYRNIAMANVQNPIVIDQNYCPHNSCPTQQSGIRISDVKYENIRGTSATKVAVKFDCSKKHPCRGIKLENVALTFGSRSSDAVCNNADGRALGFVQPSSCL